MRRGEVSRMRKRRNREIVKKIFLGAVAALLVLAFIIGAAAPFL
jgi:cell division protein FtsN